ncbi:hypothetical protein KIW84_071449 [Lathyrus oleraceus]|uniref:Uncharacterized protein n=2 Tax=Pisum sativum TaxID=3888 RepID=A0A9D4ZW18_PEA|nr:hypothetical protein KIW84_071449 [Pisum sativum]
MLEDQKQHQSDKKTTLHSTKNQTKLINPNTFTSKNNTKTIKSNNLNSSKNQTKTIKTGNTSSKSLNSNNLNSSKNQTKTIKSNDTSTKTLKSNNLNPSKNKTNVTSKNASSKSTPPNTNTLKKLNSTTTTKFKKVNSTSTSTKKPLDLVKASNKTTKSTTTDKNKPPKTQTHDTNKKPKTQTPPSRTLEEQEDEEDDDFASFSEFKDLPNKFHRTLIPDLERISTSSKAYITNANNEMTKGFKPYVGKKYAPTIAAIVSTAFVLLPLLLVSLLCNRVKTYFSLQKILIFIQIYLSIYFTILCISTLVTGTEPLKFLFSTSQSTYICFQVLQTLGYVFYLLLLVMYLVLVFSTECGLGSKFLGLAQIFVGFSVGLHYYVTVFHRVVLRQPPKSNWKIHGIYATSFLLICLFAMADRRKKAYVENDGEEGKKN